MAACVSVQTATRPAREERTQESATTATTDYMNIAQGRVTMCRVHSLAFFVVRVRVIPYR